ncbi:MAG TPA: AAA family ATPase [Solirubrobacteraceae bacterium]|nr:AAA family ATPase [Solirubrobacteraceae bacterium]
MAENPSARSVKIGADERTGWSSERPRRDGAAPRPVDVSVRGRVLAPTDRMRYSPGSLVVVVGAPASEAAKFADRVIQERGAVLSLARVRELLAGRVPDEEIEARAHELLGAAVRKRLQAGQSVVVPVETLDPAERETYVRLAHGLQRPRHLILVEAPRERVEEDERTLDELRRALNAAELGQEGFQTALRLSGQALAELKRVVFARRPPED